MSETSPRAEALDPRLMELAEGIRLSRRFHLFLVFVDEASAAGALAEVVERHLRASGEEDATPDVLTPYGPTWNGGPLRPEVLVESLLGPLVEGDETTGRWRLVDATPSPLRDDAAWEALLPRLNERRNLIARAHARPLVLALPARMEPALKRLAPDLWSIRSQTTRLERVGSMTRWGRPYRGIAVALVPIAPGVTAWHSCTEAVRQPADAARRLLRAGSFTHALGKTLQAIDACSIAQEQGEQRQARALVELFLLTCEACVALGRLAEARRALHEAQRWCDRGSPPPSDPSRPWYRASVTERAILLTFLAKPLEDLWLGMSTELVGSLRGDAFFSLWMGRARLLREQSDAAELLAHGRALATALPRRDPRLEAALCVDLAWVALRTGRPWDAQDELTNARSLLATRARAEDAAVFEHLAGAIADALPVRVAGAA